MANQSIKKNYKYLESEGGELFLVEAGDTVEPDRRGRQNVRRLKC